MIVLYIGIEGEGYWKGGNFTFEISIPDEYNNKVREWGREAGIVNGGIWCINRVPVVLLNLAPN